MRLITHFLAALLGIHLRGLLKMKTIKITAIAAAITTITTTTPATMEGVLLVAQEHSDGCVAGEHSGSLREEMATEQCGSTVISTPVTMTPGPPLTQSSIREMRESLPLSEVPSSLAR